jgi:hypothetical protein
MGGNCMSQEQCIWVIDATNVICEVNDGYRQFAIDNGAAELAESSVGMSVLSVISGQPVVELYASLLAAVRRSTQPVELTFRCDSPHRWRRLSMQIEADKLGCVTFSSQLMASGPIALSVPLGDDEATDYPVVRLCSWCNRILSPHGWRDVPEAIREMQLLEFPPRQAMVHTLCSDCDEMLAESVLSSAPPPS